MTVLGGRDKATNCWGEKEADKEKKKEKEEKA